jgi:hypothetical protein
MTKKTQKLSFFAENKTGQEVNFNNLSYNVAPPGIEPEFKV